MPRVTNISRRGARDSKASLRQLQSNVKRLLRDLEASDASALSKDVTSVVKRVAEGLRDSLEASATAARWPSRLTSRVFAFTDLAKAPTPKKRKTALVGVPTGRRDQDSRIWKTWTSKEGKRLAMSLARMFESGTSRMAARPAIAPVIQREAERVKADLAAGLREAIVKHGNSMEAS